eukprot:1188449-Prorocentrum_minimum.AAC.4
MVGTRFASLSTVGSSCSRTCYITSTVRSDRRRGGGVRKLSDQTSASARPNQTWQRGPTKYVALILTTSSQSRWRRWWPPCWGSA